MLLLPQMHCHQHHVLVLSRRSLSKHDAKQTIPQGASFRHFKTITRNVINEWYVIQRLFLEKFSEHCSEKRNCRQNDCPKGPHIQQEGRLSGACFLSINRGNIRGNPWNARHFYQPHLPTHLEHQLCYLNQYFLLDPGNWFFTISFFVTDRRPRSQNTDCYTLWEGAKETKGEFFIGRSKLYGNSKHGLPRGQQTREWEL